VRSFREEARKREERIRALKERGEQIERERAEDVATNAASPEPLPEDRLVGIVQAIDDGLATVLVGADEVEYVFPLDLLPEGARVDMMLYLVFRNGRLEVIGERAARKAEPGSAVQDRLDRGIARRRLGEPGPTGA
jgi:hypothetical protein